MPLIRIGGHLSIARGFAAMAREAESIGCETAQVFSRSPRGGPARPIDGPEAERMAVTLRGAGIGPLVVHVPYFVSPASDNEELGRLATQLVIEDGLRAAQLRARYVVVHGGHRRGDGPAAAVGAVVQRLDAAAAALAEDDRTAGCVELLVENGAGGRGAAVADLAGWSACVLELRERGRTVAACLDTAHLWGAGWDLGVSAAEIAAGLDDDAAARAGRYLIDAVAQAGMLPHLRVLHLNDSGAAYGSQLDRHEHVGAGRIPIAVFRAILRDPRLAGICGIVETDPAAGGLARDVDLLKSFRA